ncbi:MAG: hypothetical protein CMP38_01250 [Rickettsiales bacterium]|nr:hypothetical protein [Rickettsiales bacterium]|tara:strand:+ start:637 stop:2349 length:1713 start_codon:yes stop_codon:yes gene_type:complete
MKYSEFIHESEVKHRSISYNNLTPKPTKGKSLKPQKIKVGIAKGFSLLAPYTYVRILEQVKAVVPLAAYLFLFQLLILRQPIAEASTLSLGLVAVIIGLAIFMEGLKTGLMPFGTIIGDTLPKKASLFVVLIIIAILGVGVTYAEPAIGALKAFGASVNPQEAPYLYEILNNRSETLVVMVGAGVGIAAVIGTIRFVRGWSLKPLIYLALAPTIALTIYAWTNPDLRTILGLAWDCGAVTTGPVTVPLVLSLGIGIAASAGKGDSSLSGFGVVTMASLFPIIAVLILAIYISQTTSVDEIIAMASMTTGSIGDSEASIWSKTPYAEIRGGVQAILPLVIYLMIVLFIILKSKLPNNLVTTYGLALSIIGMCVFNVGLTYGLGAIGGQAGSTLPAAFMEVSISEVSPIYSEILGLSIVILFAWLLGFGATLAEPALNALGLTVQELTNGAFKKSMLMYSVAGGVAFGIALGVGKIVFGFDLATVLIPLYLLAVVLTYFSTEEFVNVAWDSAGVTTGPVTVPLVLAMGLGLGNAVSATEGFGILSMASICPILAVLLMGLFIQFQQKQQKDN